MGKCKKIPDFGVIYNVRDGCIGMCKYTCVCMCMIIYVCKYVRSYIVCMSVIYVGVGVDVKQCECMCACMCTRAHIW